MADKYAAFDSSAPAPQPVTGWYDNTHNAYPNLPTAPIKAGAVIPLGFVAVTDAQWAQHLTDLAHLNWTVSKGSVSYAVVPIVYPPAGQAAILIGLGVTVTSTSTPALSGTYPADPSTISHIQSEMISIIVNGTFADGTATVAFPDITGGSHVFTLGEFKSFATAIGAFFAAAIKFANGTAPALPSSSVTIP